MSKDKKYSYSDGVNKSLLFTWKWRPDFRYPGRFEQTLIDRGWALYEDIYNPGYACEDFAGYSNGKKGPYHGGDYIQYRCLTLTEEGLEILRSWNPRESFESRWSNDAQQKQPHRKYFIEGYSIPLDQKNYYTSDECKKLATVADYEKLRTYDR